MQARLAQLGHMNDVTAWEMGDLATWMFDYCTINDTLINPVTEEEMPSYVLYNTIAKAAGKSPHSIRDYHYTSSRVPLSIRERYHVLGRHHFKALCPHFNTVPELGKLCDIVLSWSDDYGGQLISVAALRHKLTGKDGGPAQWEKKLKTATNATRKLAADEAAPAFVRSAAKGFLSLTVHPPLP
jgi:hypothetical protein